MKTYGFVVAFEYRACPRMEFQDIAEEFDLAFQVVDSRTRSLSWDCDDIVILERDYLRVALGWLPPDDDDGTWHLVAAVGPSDAAMPPEPFGEVANQIVDRMEAFLPADSILRGHAHMPVGAECIDMLFDLLRQTADAAPDHRQPQQPAEATAATTLPDDDAEEVRFERFEPAIAGYSDDIGNIRVDEIELAEPRIVAWLNTRAEPTQTLRLTVHTLALSMMLHVPAIGVFMFAYTLLRDIVPATA